MFLLTACGSTKVLENRQVERIEPPKGLLTCEPAPAVPSPDQLAGPDGDNVLAVYIARLEFARRDCWCAVKQIEAWVAMVLPPAECAEPPAGPPAEL